MGDPSPSRPGATGSVTLKHRNLPEVVVERSIDGRPKRDVTRLRKVLCEGRETQPLVFYHIVVSRHWHYYWICSDYKARRTSNETGTSRLKRWIDGFKKQARFLSRDCPAGSARKVQRGTHESGIRAVATCDGRIQLTYPDGAESSLYFQSQAGGASAPPPVATPPPAQPRSPTPVAARQSCPQCPQCPRCPPPQTKACPACPPPRQCPPQQACPKPPPCPKCDCREKQLQAGRQGFKQGVEKACKKICQEIYQKCRSIDPNTALCYRTSEYCSEKCGK